MSERDFQFDSMLDTFPDEHFRISAGAFLRGVPEQFEIPTGHPRWRRS
jgi:hypothetical protein